MTLGRDATDESIIWNPGDTKGWQHGELVDVPSVKTPEEAAVEEAEQIAAPVDSPEEIEEHPDTPIGEIPEEEGEVVPAPEGGSVTADLPQTDGPESAPEETSEPTEEPSPSTDGPDESGSNEDDSAGVPETPTETEPVVETPAEPETGGEDTVPESTDTDDTGGSSSDETAPVGPEGTEVSTNTDMEPADAPTPSPPSDLEENTNVETDALHEAIDEAGSVPEASDIEVTGEPTPVSEPNPVPGDADTAPVVTTENAGDVVSAPDVPAEPATVSNQPPTP